MKQTISIIADSAGIETTKTGYAFDDCQNNF